MLIAQLCPAPAASTDWASIVLAGAAFVVSIASLWFTALRRPAVDVEHVLEPGGYPIGGFSWSGEMPSNDHTVTLRLFIANTGATGTVIERLAITSYSEVRQGGPNLYRLGVSAGADIGIPHAMERDDAKSAWITYRLPYADAEVAATAEEIARRLVGLKAMKFKVEWTYRRPKLLRPRRRESITRSAVFTVDARGVLENLVAHWDQHAEFQHLARLAEGRASSWPRAASDTDAADAGTGPPPA